MSVIEIFKKLFLRFLLFFLNIYKKGKIYKYTNVKGIEKYKIDKRKQKAQKKYKKQVYRVNIY